MEKRVWLTACGRRTCRGGCLLCGVRDRDGDLIPDPGVHYEPLPARTPTRHPPGSAEKIEVMAARLAAGEALFHAGDAAPVRNPTDKEVRRREREIVGCRTVRVDRSVLGNIV